MAIEAALIDHTLLRPTATTSEIDRMIAEAREHRFASVCVNPVWVRHVADGLADSGVATCTVIGFPLGATTSEAKAAETRQAVADGAGEVDMVIDLGALLDGRIDDVTADIAAVRAAAPAPVVLKVILETCLLDDEQIVAACRASQAAGADFVKTSTGFSTGGATVEAVRLMRQTVGDEMGVKASGGIRTADDAEAMVAAGASRLGASAGITIIGKE